MGRGSSETSAAAPSALLCGQRRPTDPAQNQRAVRQITFTGSRQRIEAIEALLDRKRLEFRLTIDDSERINRPSRPLQMSYEMTLSGPAERIQEFMRWWEHFRTAN